MFIKSVLLHAHKACHSTPAVMIINASGKNSKKTALTSLFIDKCFLYFQLQWWLVISTVNTHFMDKHKIVFYLNWLKAEIFYRLDIFFMILRQKENNLTRSISQRLKKTEKAESAPCLLSLFYKSKMFSCYWEFTKIKVYLSQIGKVYYAYLYEQKIWVF